MLHCPDNQFLGSSRDVESLKAEDATRFGQLHTA
jgi:hypothetical protein